MELDPASPENDTEAVLTALAQDMAQTAVSIPTFFVDDHKLPDESSSQRRPQLQSNAVAGISIHDSASFHQGNSFNNITINSTVPTPGPSRKEIVEWIPRLDFRSVHLANLERWLEGTGQWLLDHEFFQTWLKSNDRPIWCYGMPGVGKTILSSVVIKKLKQLKLGPPVGTTSIGIGYMFFKYSDTNITAVNLISTLLYQFAQQAPIVHPSLVSLYKKHSLNGFLATATWREYCEALRQTIRQFSDVYLVIDAFDESRDDDGINLQPSTRRKILEFLQTIKGFVRVFVTSRDVSPTRLGLGDQSAFEKLEIVATEKDMLAYIDARISSDSLLSQYAASFESKIRKRSIKQAAGQFLLVQLHMDLLSRAARSRDRRQIKNALKKLSSLSVLDEAYAFIMRNVWKQTPEDLNIARHVFSWLIYGKDSLLWTIDMVQAALCIGPDEQSDETGDSDSIGSISTAGSSPISEDDLIYVCHGLVTVNPHTRKIRFVHYTAEDYFRRDEVRRKLLPEAEATIARTCIHYLLQYHSIEDDFPTKREEAFYRYCSLHWSSHAKQHEDHLSDLIERFATSGRPLQAAFDKCLFARKGEAQLRRGEIEVQWWSKPDSERLDEEHLHKLHIAAFYGLRRFCTECLLNGVVVDIPDSRGYTPLRWAALGGSESVVQLLLDWQADPFSQDSTSGETLFWLLGARLRHHHISSIEVFHNARAWIGDEVHTRYGATSDTVWPAAVIPLCSYSVLNLLISRTGEVDRMRFDGRTLLSIAAENWQWDLVRQLCERSADRDAADINGATPLLWSLQPPRNTCNIEEIDAYDSTFVHVGTKHVAEGVLQITDFLISELEIEPSICSLIGTNIEAKDINLRTALSLASENRFHTVVETLIEKGAEVNSSDRSGRTPLHWASSLPIFETIIVENLQSFHNAKLEFGERQSVKQNVGRVEGLTTGKPIERIVYMLLCNGADSQALTFRGETARDLAIWDNLPTVANMLLEFDTDYPRRHPEYEGQGRIILRAEQQDCCAAILHAMMDLRGKVQIKNHGMFHDSSLIAKIDATVETLSMFHNSTAVTEERAIITNLEIYNNSTARLNNRSLLQKVKMFHKSSISIQDQARVEDLSGTHESRISVYAEANIGKFTLMDESIGMLHGKSTIDTVNTRHNSRIMIMNGAKVCSLAIFDRSFLHVRGNAVVQDISSYHESQLIIENAKEIGTLHMHDGSRAYINHLSSAIGETLLRHKSWLIAYCQRHENIHATDNSRVFAATREEEFSCDKIHASNNAQVQLGKIPYLDTQDPTAVAVWACNELRIPFEDFSRALVRYRDVEHQSTSQSQ